MAVLSYACVAYSMSQLPQAVAMALLMLFPFFVGIAAFTYEQELMSKVQVLSVAGCYLGVLAVTTPIDITMKQF